MNAPDGIVAPLPLHCSSTRQTRADGHLQNWRLPRGGHWDVCPTRGRRLHARRRTSPATRRALARQSTRPTSSRNGAATQNQRNRAARARPPRSLRRVGRRGSAGDNRGNRLSRQDEAATQNQRDQAARAHPPRSHRRDGGKGSNGCIQSSRGKTLLSWPLAAGTRCPLLELSSFWPAPRLRRRRV